LLRAVAVFAGLSFFTDTLSIFAAIPRALANAVNAAASLGTIAFAFCATGTGALTLSVLGAKAFAVSATITRTFTDTVHATISL
jgi:hypothetical protein